MSLNGASGEVVWARSLAAVSDQFVDVDSTPTIIGNTIYASSYSGGLYALDAKDGVVRWRVGIEGVELGVRRRVSGSTSRRRGRGCTPPTSTDTSCGARG